MKTKTTNLTTNEITHLLNLLSMDKDEYMQSLTEAMKHLDELATKPESHAKAMFDEMQEFYQSTSYELGTTLVLIDKLESCVSEDNIKQTPRR